jgi:hypothetical protein
MKLGVLCLCAAKDRPRKISEVGFVSRLEISKSQPRGIRTIRSALVISSVVAMTAYKMSSTVAISFLWMAKFGRMVHRSSVPLGSEAPFVFP